MHNGANLPFIECAPGNRFTVTDAEGDFCSRTNKDGFGIARCTRPFYRADSFDGTRKLAFQRPLIIHLFAELADTKLFLIEQFETDRAAFGQTLLLRGRRRSS